MSFVSKFLQGNWLGKAKLYAFNPQKLKALLSELSSCLSRKGLSSAKENLLLMRSYLSDIATGKYYYDLETKDVSTSVDDGVRDFFGEIFGKGEQS